MNGCITIHAQTVIIGSEVAPPPVLPGYQLRLGSTPVVLPRRARVSSQKCAKCSGSGVVLGNVIGEVGCFEPTDCPECGGKGRVA